MFSLEYSLQLSQAAFYLLLILLMLLTFSWGTLGMFA